jgi:hypothetical protein
MRPSSLLWVIKGVSRSEASSNSVNNRNYSPTSQQMQLRIVQNVLLHLVTGSRATHDSAACGQFHPSSARSGRRANGQLDLLEPVALDGGGS